jgi:hypothetical protein
MAFQNRHGVAFQNRQSVASPPLKIPFIERVSQRLMKRCGLISWLAKAPMGKEGLV